MTLASKLSSQFDGRSRFKGQGLFAAAAVRLKEGSPRHFFCEVQGSRYYQVRLQFDGNELSVSCECPYFDREGPCKHLWAATLEADRRGLLSEARDSRELTVVDDPNQEEMVWDESGNDDIDDEIPGEYYTTFRQHSAHPPQPRIPLWQDHLTAIQRSFSATPDSRGAEIVYVIDTLASKASGALDIEIFSRTRKKNGEWSALKAFRIAPNQVQTLPDPIDTEAIAAILGGQDHYAYYYSSTLNTSRRKVLPPALARKVIPLIAPTGRLAMSPGGFLSNMTPVIWDAGEPWRFHLEVRPAKNDQWSISGSLRRANDRMALTEPVLIIEGGFVFARNRVALLDDSGAFPWIAELKNLKQIVFPDNEREAVLSQLLDTPILPPLDLDEALKFEERRVTPRLGLKLKQEKDGALEGRLILDYGRGWTSPAHAQRGVYFPEERLYILRDTETENAARDTLKHIGLRVPADVRAPFRLSPKSMPRAVRELLRAGWHVEAEGRVFRTPGAKRVEVRSGIDWFELHGEVDYDGLAATLPQLLAAVRRGDGIVQLGDGTCGMLPEEWLEKFAPLVSLGGIEEDHLRFRRNQATLLDALLAAQPEVRVDELFSRVRKQMSAFKGVATAAQPEGFVGQLRDYQCEGLGWIEFLREFGFGGCLADDMGLGKTAQVLAALESRRAEGRGPSLVVAPRSLMFNWREEAARFTPQLRVLEHSGLARSTASIAQHDLILTTYGTLVRDAPSLAEVDFDYVVLDEAQAIKNASTASAKAVRLLRGRHRLALSGTPVENHLGELWSIFEFLNPGMLGEAKTLRLAGSLAQNPGEDARRLLAQGLRPFILRRTKLQVARELPEKTEQTIYCELDSAERRQYEDLRRYYREKLLKQVSKEGLGRSKIYVLEALLRLRQAACHPGLLDLKRASESSAKLDTLIKQLDEVREEGHKALVFSQFTSLLAIVRARLDDAAVKYEYLDGATVDRGRHIDAFQNDPECGLFLISLKAGGLGLNLTAAEYVFLLDPWWNPAVEAQAIDRAHRIGQLRPVFAYRLITRDTVEERVLELQKTKRELADAILGEDNRLIRDLKREDLELLLS